MNFFKQYKINIEESLKNFFQKLIINKTSIPEQNFKKALEYATLNQGKKFRPILGLICFDLFKNSSQNSQIPKKIITRNKAISVLISLELIHAFSLVHDDLPGLDNDDLRRGKLTVWKKFGLDIGILTGDELLNLAYMNLNKQAPDYCLRELIELLTQCSGINGMIGGQTRDLYFEKNSPDLNELIETHKKKTGQLIIASCLMGAILAKANQQQLKLLKKYAEIIGLAFQVKDDLLDLEGDEKKVGKKLNKDLNKKGFINLIGQAETKKMLLALIKEGVEIAKLLNSFELEEICNFVEKRNV